ncbi:MAG: hypothetical protein IJU75_04940 [Clostridia bacterium]|nr:hypothetical protein [Clostridia bacterium]
MKSIIKCISVTVFMCILITALVVGVLAESSNVYDPVPPSEDIENYLADNFNHLIGYGHFSDGKTHKLSDLGVSSIRVRKYGYRIDPEADQRTFSDIIDNSWESWILFAETKDSGEPVMLIELEKGLETDEVGFKVGGETLPLIKGYNLMKSLIEKAGLSGEPIAISLGTEDRAMIFSFNGDERIVIVSRWYGDFDETYGRVTDYTQLPTLKQIIDVVKADIIKNRELYGDTIVYGGVDLSDIRVSVPEAHENFVPLIIGCTAGGLAVIAGIVAAIVLGKKSKKADISSETAVS